jgi:DNA-binding Lrp family transcriptional regulator
MRLEILNPYTVKIIIAARKEDSIRAISKRIGLSYGWTYKWVLELEKVGVFRKSGKRVFLDEKNRFYREVSEFVKTAFRKDVGFHYSILGLFGIRYCFTGIDAVFIWTDGGYNISRYRDYYPIFIKVRKSDKKMYEFYIRKLGLKGKIFYRPVFLEDFTVSLHKGMPVDSLKETIEFMKKYIYNFEPALEMIQEMYGKKLGIKYKEVVANV